MPDHELIQNFNTTISSFAADMADLDETQAGLPLAPGKWSRKQILGHLIDSASKNHQRFVRAAASESVSLPGYDQEFWVATQKYSELEWKTLLAFWKGYNYHLLHVLKSLPDDAFKHRLKIGDGPEISLADLAADYLRHLQHHLRQIAG